MVKRLGFLVFTQAARVRLQVWENVCIFNRIFAKTEKNQENYKYSEYFNNVYLF